MAIGWQVLSHVEGTIEQGIMEESATQKYPLGFKLELADGRIFRYCKAGGSNLAAGKMTGSPVGASERDATVNLGAGVAIGAKTLTVTAVGTITTNQFAEGFLSIPLGTGLGLQYKIKSNTSGAEATIVLYDPIVTALVATTDAICIPSMWTGIILTPDDVIKATGVPTIPVTTLYYYWSQTGGVGMCLMGTAVGAGTDERVFKIDIAAAVDGALDGDTNSLSGTETVGHMLFDSTDTVDTEYWPIVLSIDS